MRNPMTNDASPTVTALHRLCLHSLVHSSLATSVHGSRNSSTPRLKRRIPERFYQGLGQVQPVNRLGPSSRSVPHDVADC